MEIPTFFLYLQKKQNMISGIPMEMALQLLSRYIYDHKGVLVKPIPPSTPREIELFEQMISYPLDYYRINI